MRIATLALALTLSLGLLAACDADPDVDAAVETDAGVPDATDAGTPPATLPPPVAGPDPDVGPGDPPGIDPGTDPGTDPGVDPNGETTVPVRFQGSFAADAAACDAAGDPTQLTIGSDTISFHESTGPVTEVSSGPSDITITAELTGEGETRDATYRFRLSDDGDTLTDLDNDMARIRCD